MNALKKRLGLMLVLILGTLACGVASATPFVIKFAEQGSDVVATGSGAVDLTGLTYGGINRPNGTWLVAVGPILTMEDGVSSMDSYFGATGPTDLGPGNFSAVGTFGGGDNVSVIGTSFLLPLGYVSGSPLANSATWGSATFASLGVTPGSYVWTWGSGAEQSITIQIGDVPVNRVPEPPALGVFGLSVLLVGMFAGFRRRMS